MKTKNIFLLLLLSFGVNLFFAQGENDNWYFGNYAAVNFTNTTPAALTDSQMYTEEGSGAVSDSNGHLLFYTNGATIWTRQHQPMQNGTGLTGHSYSTQQLAIAKNPKNPKQYYVFTAALTDPSSSYIAYSIVDMSQGNIGTNGHPLGRVLPNFKNIPILDQNGNQFKTEAITVAMHSDGLSFWVLVPHGNNLYSYRVTAAGFNPVPVVSSLNISSLLTPTSYFGIKASPKIDYGSGFTNYISISLWRPSPNSNTFYRNKVLSFDDTTGQITSHYVIDINTEASYISEFNKNGKILYLGQHRVYAVNLSASSSSVVYNMIYDGYLTGRSFWGIQRNSRNEIYISSPNYEYLSKITNPDTYGASGLNLDDIYLQGKRTYLGLPQQMLMTNAGATECVIDLALQNPETHVDHTYSVSEYIITSNNYSTNSSNGKIIMKAADYIKLLPNTFIKSKSDFLATIAPCEVLNRPVQKNQGNNQKRVSLTLDLTDKGDTDLVKVYPNPASDFVKIDSKTNIISWEMYDLSGKVILKGNGDKIDVKSMISGSYLINITLEKGVRVSKKIIVK